MAIPRVSIPRGYGYAVVAGALLGCAAPIFPPAPVPKARLPAGGKATPMTYLGADGRQYVVISAGGDGKAWGKSDEVIAYALQGRRTSAK